MFGKIVNEFQDKKHIKNVVRFFQSFYKHWANIEQYEVNCKDIRIFDFPFVETFFGYYDRSPLNFSREYILFHRSSLSTKWNPSKTYPIELVLWNLKEDYEVKSWRVLAYNWQQGVKPQWIDNHLFIFNNYDIDSCAYYSTVVDVRNMKEERYALPSYESCDDFYVTLNFSRLAKFRPDYGYRNVEVKELDDCNDGIFINRFDDNAPQLLISIEQLKNIHHHSSMDGAKHKFNHIMFSPNRDKMMFMHRWITAKGKVDRLYTYTFSTAELKLVADYGMVSHCYWYGDEIVGYMNGPGNIAGYYKLSSTDIVRLNDKIQHFGDGHPSIFGDEMIFDTYPDSNRLKHLYKFNLIVEDLEKIGSFREPLGFENQCRCDLHPRFIDNNLLSIDSTHRGKRCLVLIRLK